jgi:phage terminase small subunit
MPTLLNAQHEIFAQEVAKGRQIGEAYALAGFNPHPANPTRLGKKRHVAERIKEIKEKATERAAEQLVISKKRVLEELAKIAFANMADFMTVGASGEPVLNWRNLTHDQAAALQEVTIDEYIEGRGENARQVRRVKFKLAPKQAALEKIGIELGMFINRSDNKHSFEKRFSQLSPEEQGVVAADVLKRAREAIERQKVIEAEAQQVKRPASDGAVSNPKPL